MKVYYDLSKSDVRNYGLIYVISGECKFPSEDWDDFISDILSGWKYEVLKNQKDVFATFTLFFMDGDYYLLCVRCKNYITVLGLQTDDPRYKFKETMPYCDFEELILSL